MDEFELIRTVLAPLARGSAGALGLADDAAFIEPEPGQDLVVTADAVIEGVHFLGSDPADQIGQKALRVNLSDLAAKGARPIGYLLCLHVPAGSDIDRVRGIAAGLARDQAAFGLALLGGDTVATPGPLSLSVTALGQLPRGTMIRRSGAKLGDLIAVSGELGAAALGLRIARDGAAGIEPAAAAGFLERYRRPVPRLALGAALRPLASACLDVSDGLIGDAGHLARASGVRLVIEAGKLPHHPLLVQSGDRTALAEHLCQGDDYELLFTLPRARAPALAQVSQASATPVTVIGRVEEGEGVALVAADGRPLAVKSPGYRHF